MNTIKNKQLIVIDDSGDPGFKKTSSSHFVLASAVFINEEDAEELSSKISNYRSSLGWRKDREFKFSKDRKEIIKELLDLASSYDFEIYSVYIDKNRFNSYNLDLEGQSLYIWMMKELLKTIQIGNAKIEIDGVPSKRSEKEIKTYFRQKIDFSHRKVQIVFEDSKKDSLIQLADLIAGSINRSLKTEKEDAQNYIKSIRKHIRSLKEIK